MDDLNLKVATLAKSHPVPNEDKIQQRLSRLERMTAFYRDKLTEAPEKQALLFGEFVGALMYACSVIKMYRKLTNRLAELAEEKDDEDITKSI